MEFDEIKKIIKPKLTEKRYYHTLCVFDMAIKLAKKYNADENIVGQAALFHDIFKCTCCENLLQIADNYDIILSDEHQLSPSLYHSIIGAGYIKKEFNISDEISNAVYYHTMARQNMTCEEKIIYVADCVSKDRSFQQRDKLEKIAFDKLDEAVFEILKFTLYDIIKKNGYLCNETISAYNFYNRVINQFFAEI